MIITTTLKLDNGKSIFFEYTHELEDRLNNLYSMYQQFEDFDVNRGFRSSMIKTAISDIDMESKDDTSMVESVAAICCDSIKNKEQKSALNMIKLLESGILERSQCINNEYVIDIWGALTNGNRNIQAKLTKGFRKTPVRVIRVGKSTFQNQVVHVAPSADKVEQFMGDLCTFYNSNNVSSNQFTNAVVKSAIFSAYFVYVHPFLDGNGRTSRLLTNKLLIDHGLSKFRYISFTSELVRHKKAYGTLIENIEKSNTGDMSVYINAIVQWFADLFKRLVERQHGKIDISMLDSRQKVMLQVVRGSAQGTHKKHYKETWNSIAKEKGYKTINIKEAEADLNKLLLEDLIVADERYVRYPGFKYFKN